LKAGGEAFLILDSADTEQAREKLKKLGLAPLDDETVYGK
jgi:hypothetical protein